MCEYACKCVCAYVYIHMRASAFTHVYGYASRTCSRLNAYHHHTYVCRYEHYTPRTHKVVSRLTTTTSYVPYTYTHTYIHTHIHTYIHTYMHTYIHAYMHTYIHTYIMTVPSGPTERSCVVQALTVRIQRLPKKEAGPTSNLCGTTC